MSGSDGLRVAEYASLREEILRADDQVNELIGFGFLCASFLVAEAIGSSREGSAVALAVMSLIPVALSVKVREKRRLQSRLSAYIQIFFEGDPAGWERRWSGRRRDRSEDEPWAADMVLLAGSALGCAIALILNALIRGPFEWTGKSVAVVSSSVVVALVSVLTTIALVAPRSQRWEEDEKESWSAILEGELRRGQAN